MSKKIWTTEAGVKIEYKDITNHHLMNILSYIKRRAKGGVTVVTGGFDLDGHPDGDVDVYYGEDVEKMLDYKGLRTEANRRGLLGKKGGFS